MSAPLLIIISLGKQNGPKARKSVAARNPSRRGKRASASSPHGNKSSGVRMTVTSSRGRTGSEIKRSVNADPCPTLANFKLSFLQIGRFRQDQIVGSSVSIFWEGGNKQVRSMSVPRNEPSHCLCESDNTWYEGEVISAFTNIKGKLLFEVKYADGDGNITISQCGVNSNL